MEPKVHIEVDEIDKDSIKGMMVSIEGNPKSIITMLVVAMREHEVVHAVLKEAVESFEGYKRWKHTKDKYEN